MKEEELLERSRKDIKIMEKALLDLRRIRASVPAVLGTAVRKIIGQSTPD